jgi:hypothetical protein
MPSNSQSVFRPINFVPDTNTAPVVTFSVLMAIVPSTIAATNRDEFRWSVYNSSGVPLFSLDFDTSVHEVFYSLDDPRGFIPTDTAFEDNTLYDLVITMNFARNLWSASANNMVLVNSKPISTIGSKLDVGDVDAVWVIANTNAPGDNYMLFDDYKLTAETLQSAQPTLELLSVQSNGGALLRLFGEPRIDYVIEGTTNLTQWIPLKTNSAPDGVSDFLDVGAAGLPRRFYRAHQVTP